MCQIIIPVTFGDIMFSGDARSFTSGRQQIRGNWFAVSIGRKVWLGFFGRWGVPLLYNCHFCLSPGTGNATNAGFQWGTDAHPDDRAVSAGSTSGTLAAAGSRHD